MVDTPRYLGTDLVNSLLNVTQEVSGGRYQFGILQIISNNAVESAMDTCLVVAHQLSPSILRIAALSEMSSFCEPSQQNDLLEETLAQTSLLSEHRGFIILHILLPSMNKVLVRHFATRLLDIASSIEDKDEKIATIAGLLPYLPLELQETVTSEVSRSLSGIFEPSLRTFVVSHMSTQLTPEIVSRSLLANPPNWFERLLHDRGLQLLIYAWGHNWSDLDAEAQSEALLLALRIPDIEPRAKALAYIAQFLSDNQLATALSHVYATRSIADRAQLLVSIASYVPADQMDAFLVSTQSLDGGYTTPDIVIAIAPRLSPKQFDVVLNILSQRDSAYFSWQDEQIVITLARHLPDSQVGRAVQIAESTSTATSRLRMLLGLAPRLNTAQFGNLLDTILTMTNDLDELSVLERLATCLPMKLLSRFLNLCEVMSRSDAVLLAISGLTPRLAPEGVTQVIEFVRKLSPIGIRSKALSMLAPYSDDDLLLEVLAYARSSNNIDDKYDSLYALAPQVSTPWSDEWIEMVIDAAQKIGQITEEYSPVEGGQASSLRHYDAEDILINFLSIVEPGIQSQLVTALLGELQVSNDRLGQVEVLIHLLDFLPDGPIEANRATFIAMTKDHRDDRWVQSLDAYQASLPIPVLRYGLGIALRQEAQDGFFAPHDALALALSGKPLHQIRLNGTQEDPVGGGPGNIMGMLYNVNLLRVRPQHRQLTVIVPDRVKVGKQSEIQVGLVLLRGQSRTQLVSARTTNLVIQIESTDPAVHFDNGKERIAEVAWNKDGYPLTFAIRMTRPGKHSINVKVSGNHGNTIIEKTHLTFAIDAGMKASSQKYALHQVEFTISPNESSQ